MKRLTYTRSYESDFPLAEASGEEVVVLAADAVSRLGWKILAIAPAALLAQTGQEEIVVWVWNGAIRIKSISTDGRVHDWGINKQHTKDLEEQYLKLREQGHHSDVYQRFEELHAAFPFYGDAGLLPYGPAWYPPKKPAKKYLFTEGFVITPALIIMNILVFLLMCLAGAGLVEPDARSIVSWGGNYGPLTVHGQWWRLLTCEFVHIGVIHLLANMLALLFLGSFLEPLLGRPRFLAGYLVSAITASLLSLIVHPDTVSAGASGAIFGLMGIFFALLTVGLTDRRTTRALLPNFAVYIVYALFSGLQDHIDNAGHLGGLLGGLIVGYSIYPGLKKHITGRPAYRPIIVLSIAAILIAAVVLYRMD